MKLKTIIGIGFLLFILSTIMTIGYDRSNPDYVDADITLQSTRGITLDEYIDNEVTRINNPASNTLNNLKMEFSQEVFNVHKDYGSDAVCIQAKLEAIRSVDCDRLSEVIR